MRTFDRYKQNLRQHDDIGQLGWWSVTTQKHINYAASELGLEIVKSKTYLNNS